MIKKTAGTTFGSVIAASVIAGLALFASAAQASPNLVANGSFETGDFTSWTQFGNTGFTGVSGTFGGIAPTDGLFQGFFGPVGSTGGIQQSIATGTGITYIVSFDLFNFGGTPNSFIADFGGTLLSLTDDAGLGYTTFTYMVTTSGGPTDLIFTTQQDPSYWLLDHISVVETPEPATLALMGVALLSMLGLGLMRRRADA